MGQRIETVTIDREGVPVDINLSDLKGTDVVWSNEPPEFEPTEEELELMAKQLAKDHAAAIKENKARAKASK